MIQIALNKRNRIMSISFSGSMEAQTAVQVLSDDPTPVERG